MLPSSSSAATDPLMATATTTTSATTTASATMIFSLPLVVSVTGCMTIALLGALLVVRNEVNRRKELSRLADNDGASKKSSNNITTIDRTIYPGGRISVYYATQTGTAESFAQQLQREGQDHGFYIHVVDMEETTLEGLTVLTPFGGGDDDNDDDDNNHNNTGSKDGPARAVILASTYGEGEPTDNATAMVNAFKEAMEGGDNKSLLSSRLEYTVFGLGNREYELFNAMGKFFDSSLESLGAKRIYELGLGDDNEDLEADFEKWKDGMWLALKERYLRDVELPTKQSSLTQVGLPECEYSIVYHKPANGRGTIRPQPKEVPLEQVHGSSKHYFTSIDCPVSARRELRTPLDGGSTVHIEIDISKHPTLQEYQTADNLGVLPLNQQTVVESVANSLRYDLDAVFSLGPASPAGRDRHEWHGDPFPMPITVRECLTRYLDLTSAPRRSDLKLLSLYAKDPVDRRALQRLSSKEGKQQYKEKIMESFVGMVDLLKLCPSLEIPLEHLISICHFMLPRFYTISSCPKVFPDSIHLTVAVTREARKDGSFLDGVCSTHLSTRRVQSTMDEVRVFVRPSSFRLPQDPSKPIIMIGPGTGIAPMRALLQERRHQQQQQRSNANGSNSSSNTVGPNILFFGCKRPDMDYLYQDELERYQTEGVLTELHLAFSRHDPTGKKVYVQHLLRQRSTEVWKLLDEDGAYVYVCGGVKMGHDVTECLKEIVSTVGHRSMDQAAVYLTKLSSQGRYVQELWS